MRNVHRGTENSSFVSRSKVRVALRRMAPPPTYDPVLAPYLRDLDRTLLRENLKLSPAQRLEKLVRFTAFADELRKAGSEARTQSSPTDDRSIR